MKKAGKWILRIFIALVLLVLLVLGGFSLGERITFFSFYSNADRYDAIPGLWDGYVPQGYCAVEGKDFRLACGYMKDGEASRIYVMPKDGSKPTYVEMKNADGSDNTSHTGGVAVMGDFVYVTGKIGCDVFSLADITDGDGIATVRAEVKTINDPAYCYIHDGILYTGSFYRAGDYDTPAEHHITTPAGDSNTAIISVYSLDLITGLTYSEIPDMVISTTGAVQGMAFMDDNKLALSTSWGLSKSHIYVYDLEKVTFKAGGFEVDGKTLPISYLDSAALEADIVAPPMAEQIIYEDGVIYIMNESACMKYLFGKLTSGSHVYGYKYK